MRVADYIVDRLYKAGARHTFMVSGGGMMFLSDALQVHPDMHVVCNHHEQASAMAAAGYAKYTGGIGVAFTSTGCGATNAITGLLTVWQDSVPCVFISGQVKKTETTRGMDLRIRQLGTQEADIIAIVQSITKYAVMVTDPAMVPYELEKALHLARSGRPGPVWIDVPMDVQGAQVPEEALIQSFSSLHPYSPAIDDCGDIAEMISDAKRPVIIAGQGVRIAGAMRELRTFAERYGIPVVAPYLGVGLLETDHPLYAGVIGVKGSRAGNLAMQNADLILSLGSRLSVTAIGYEYALFAREARKVVVDIDPVEHTKKTIAIDRFVQADVKDFLACCMPRVVPDTDAWVQTCRSWKERYPVCLPEYRVRDDDTISMYHFVDTLSRIMEDDAVVISDAGSAFYVTTQAINLRGAQRYLTSGAQAEMGFTLPAAIGASFARNEGSVYGITGDGSFQMNIQDLQTIVHHQLPIKLFVLNNNGYLSIRATQTKFFEGRLVGTDKSSGLSLPETKKIADAYGIAYRRLSDSATLGDDLASVLAQKGPVLCEVMCRENEPVVPTASSKKRDDGKMVSRPLEDMLPFLPRDEYLSNMIVRPVEE